jgi:hypothetical protein
VAQENDLPIFWYKAIRGFAARNYYVLNWHRVIVRHKWLDRGLQLTNPNVLGLVCEPQKLLCVALNVTIWRLSAAEAAQTQCDHNVNDNCVDLHAAPNGWAERRTRCCLGLALDLSRVRSSDLLGVASLWCYRRKEK